MSNKEKNL